MSDAVRSSGRGGSPEAQRIRAIETRLSLVETAAALFGAKGFHATGTPEIAAAAAVTRGSLYHHFESKEALFEAIFRNALADLNGEARGAVRHLSGDTWAQFVGALGGYLRILAERDDLRRIILIDGPPILGWSRWHALQSEWIETGIVATLVRLRAEGVIVTMKPEPAAILIQGAVNDAALAIAHSADPAAAMTALGEAMIALIEGLRVHGTARPPAAPL